MPEKSKTSLVELLFGDIGFFYLRENYGMNALYFHGDNLYRVGRIWNILANLNLEKPIFSSIPEPIVLDNGKIPNHDNHETLYFFYALNPGNNINHNCWDIDLDKLYLEEDSIETLRIYWSKLS